MVPHLTAYEMCEIWPGVHKCIRPFTETPILGHVELRGPLLINAGVSVDLYDVKYTQRSENVWYRTGLSPLSGIPEVEVKCCQFNALPGAPRV